MDIDAISSSLRNLADEIDKGKDTTDPYAVDRFVWELERIGDKLATWHLALLMKDGAHQTITISFDD